MNIKTSLLALTASVFALSATVIPALAAPIPIESIAKHSAISNVNMSPDGKHIVGLIAVDGQKWPVISIWKTGDLKAKPVWIPTKKMRYKFVDFLGNDKIIFVSDQPITARGKKDFTNKLFVADLDGNNIKEPMKKSGTLNDAVRRAESRGITTGIFNDRLKSKEFVLINKVDVGTGSTHIYRYNTKTGATKRVGKTGRDWSFISAMVNPITGDLLGKNTLDNVDGDFWSKVYLRDTPSSPWIYHPALSYRLKDRKSIDILGFDGGLDKLVLLSNADRDYAAAYSYNIRTKKLNPSPVYSSPKFEIADVIMMKKEGEAFSKPNGVVIGGPRRIVKYTDTYWKGVQANLERKFTGMNVSLGNRTKKHNRALVTVSSSTTPPSYFIYKNGDLTPLGSSRPWMKPADSGKARWVNFKARDGLNIPAILTLPPGYKRTAGRISTVVLPHGGPWGRDSIRWDGSGWPQFLTSRGIAVIQPQYRGSTGLGMKLWKAGDMEWGQKMSDDNDDAAAFLVKQGIADPDKVAIFGYSYGGFAAIAASVRPNSPYQCAISGAGVSSLDRIGNLWGGNRISYEYQAWTVKGMDPIKNVDKANIPILLYHGDGDRQADTVHSRIFYKAMKAAGKDIKYVEIDTMWHQLPWYPEWHTETLTEIENYLKSDKCGLI